MPNSIKMISASAAALKNLQTEEQELVDQLAKKRKSITAVKAGILRLRADSILAAFAGIEYLNFAGIEYLDEAEQSGLIKEALSLTLEGSAVSREVQTALLRWVKTQSSLVAGVLSNRHPNENDGELFATITLIPKRLRSYSLDEIADVEKLAATFGAVNTKKMVTFNFPSSNAPMVSVQTSIDGVTRSWGTPLMGAKPFDSLNDALFI